MINDIVEIKVAVQGDAVVGQGYMAVRGENVCAFYIDGWGKTGRIYPICSSKSTVLCEDGKFKSSEDYPSLTLEDGSRDSSMTEIYFPEFEGWQVHSVSGGKTMGVCLVNRKGWE
jgi:hypothetical protein